MLSAVATLYEKAGGTTGEKAFTNWGLRKVCKAAIGESLSNQDLDRVVSKWKHQGYIRLHTWGGR